MESYKKLFRSKRDRIIAGVCAGVAEYFGIDPIIIRVITVVVPACWIAYIVAALIVPEAED